MIINIKILLFFVWIFVKLDDWLFGGVILWRRDGGEEREMLVNDVSAFILVQDMEYGQFKRFEHILLLLDPYLPVNLCDFSLKMNFLLEN